MTMSIFPIGVALGLIFVARNTFSFAERTLDKTQSSML
jgi:hypothetical protein